MSTSRDGAAVGPVAQVLVLGSLFALFVAASWHEFVLLAEPSPRLLPWLAGGVVLGMLSIGFDRMVSPLFERRDPSRRTKRAGRFVLVVLAAVLAGEALTGPAGTMVVSGGLAVLLLVTLGRAAGRIQS